MLKVIGNQPPSFLTSLQLSGVCPHCAMGTRFNLVTAPKPNLRQDNPSELVAGYMCDLCSKAVGVLWSIRQFDQQGNPIVEQPEMILRVTGPFDYAHVPESVQKEIREALDCLSVNAYNGFASMCRRTVQSICTSLGVEGSTKVQAQIREMAELTGLDQETKDLAVEIMLAGHDGSHPHLPDVNADRAAVLLSLLRDLADQLFTRPGKIKVSAALRKAAIEEKK